MSRHSQKLKPPREGMLRRLAAKRDLAELTLLACALKHSARELHLAADRLGRISDRLFNLGVRLKNKQLT